MPVLIDAVLIGLMGGIIPGSILTILLLSVIRGGFPSGLRAFLWALAAEITVVAILLSVLFTLPIPHSSFNYIGIIGSLVLFYFASKVFRLRKIDRPEETGEIFSASKIYLLSATNAPLYIFWITVCAPLIREFSSDGMPLVFSAAVFMLCFEAAWGSSTFAVMMVFVKARGYLTNPRIMGRVYASIAALLCLIGVRMIHLSLSALGVI